MVVETNRPQNVERFMENVNKDGPFSDLCGSKCWVWTGALRSSQTKKNGEKKKGHERYGNFTEYFSDGIKRDWATHRYMWYITTGEILSDGNVLMHLCNNCSCVNPDHLEVGTHTQNMQYMLDCKRHVYGERAHNAVFTDEMVMDMRTMYADGVEMADIYVKYKHIATRTVIYHAVYGHSWKHLPMPNCKNRGKRREERRVWAKIDYNGPHGCWLWCGTTYNKFGYVEGCLLENNKYVPIHRYIWEKYNGPIPEKTSITRCKHNRLCVNPKHLTLPRRLLPNNKYVWE